jgi:8-amino-7-oxononanoate synthase
VPFESFLQKRDLDGLLRTLTPTPKNIHDFSSNDYLGLSKNQDLINHAIHFIKENGMGSTGSRLLSGDHAIFHTLESTVAQWKNTESALLFNSGYQANIGTLQALLSPSDIVFMDKLCHASLIDGVRMSGATLHRYKHNDMHHLKTLLEKYRSPEKPHKNTWIVTEYLFSMDGDFAPINVLSMLKKTYNTKLYIDESHATGIHAIDLSDADIIMGTFGKALGSSGAYIATSALIKNYLIQTARSLIYSTAQPPLIAAWNISAIDYVQKHPNLANDVLEKSAFFREKLKKAHHRPLGTSQIVPIVIGETHTTNALSQKLKDQGYWVPAVRPPTVPKNAARLRFSITANHSIALLEEIAHAL